MKRRSQKSYLTIAILYLLVSESVLANSFIKDLHVLDGRSYYILDKDLYCTANAPGKPKIRTWEDKITFSCDEILLWGKVCNDNPEVKKIVEVDVNVSDDLRFVYLHGKKYTYFEHAPSLCGAGSWCPESKLNNKGN